MEGELADDSKCQDHDVPVVADTEDLKDIINQSATEYSKYINIETSDEVCHCWRSQAAVLWYNFISFKPE